MDIESLFIFFTMNTVKRYAILFVLTFFSLPNFVFAVDENTLKVSGFGKSEDEALIDAKQRLSQSMLSKVSSDTRLYTKKIDGLISNSFTQDVSSIAEPVLMPSLSVIDKECGSQGCNITYSLSKDLWASTLASNINEILVSTSSVNAIDHASWSSFFTIASAVEDMKDAYRQHLILVNLSPEIAKELSIKIENTAQLLGKKLPYSKVNVRSDNLPFSSQVATSLIHNRFIDASSSLTIFIRTKSKSGKSGQKYAGKASAEINLIDGNSPYSGGLKKTVSKTAFSSTDKNDALEMAEKELLKKLRDAGLSGTF
ncbi:hypothetical protein G5S52_09380 [Grimontia sp. S25]|uniref:Uncharacterized protein n=1 Tax=Grimontia sedimenti TaxID=2711294 RepID=A0A6M1RHW9_9GAMM|nr:hypothetical protein [Grimontia sedimenti]NGN97861.1 hypothetical protein [Grimontia sedimenti]